MRIPLIVRRLLRILLIPLLLAGFAYGAQALGTLTMDRLIDFRGVALGPLPTGAAGPPLTSRLVVIVVDGLREDVSRQMPALQALRREEADPSCRIVLEEFEELRPRGADLPSWTGQPSLSLPGYATLGTGAEPNFSGVASNWYEGPIRVDSLLARAAAAGRPTALVTMAGWDTLYAPWATTVYTAPWAVADHDYLSIAWTTAAIGDEAYRLLQESDVALLYVHFGATDEAGHARGGDSPEYLEMALQVDAQIARLAGALDWSHDTLIVTADHGMSDNQGWPARIGGGHGGAEPIVRRVPLVMVGRGIVPGVYAEGRLADVVPTAATLLGLPIPAHSQGRTRLDALALTPQERARAALALGAQQQALYDAYWQILGAGPEMPGLGPAQAVWVSSGEWERVEEMVDAYLQQLDAAVARAEANRLWRERFARLPYLLGPLLAAAVAAALWRPRRELRLPVLLAALFVILYWGLYTLRGFTFSFTSIGGMDEMGFFLARTVDALAVMGLLAVVVGVLWRRRPWEEVVWQANLGALAVAWAMALQAGLFLWLYGLALDWRLPDLGWGFKFYVDMLAAVGVGAAGLLFCWLALGVSRLFIAADRLPAWLGAARARLRR